MLLDSKLNVISQFADLLVGNDLIYTKSIMLLFIIMGFINQSIKYYLNLYLRIKIIFIIAISQC